MSAAVRLAGAWVVLLLGGVLRAEDLRIERTVTRDWGSPGGRDLRTQRREVLWVGNDRLRVDDRASGESWIVRADTQIIVRIDTAAGTWCSWTFKEAAGARSAAAEDVREALEHAAGNDSEAGLKEWLATLAPAGGQTAKDTGDAGTVAGRAARKVAVDTPGQPGAEYTAVQGADGGRVAKILGAAGLLAPGLADALSGAGWLPVRGRWALVFPDGVARESFEVTGTANAAAPEGAWDPPPSFRKVPAPLSHRAHDAGPAPAGGHEGDPPARKTDPEADPPPGDGKDDAPR